MPRISTTHRESEVIVGAAIDELMLVPLHTQARRLRRRDRVDMLLPTGCPDLLKFCIQRSDQNTALPLKYHTTQLLSTKISTGVLSINYNVKNALIPCGFKRVPL